MLPIKKILCPTDFSEPSYEALKIGNELAVHFSSWLCLLHVVSLMPILSSPMAGTFDVNAYQSALEDSAQGQLQKAMEKYVSRGLRTCRPIITSGSAADEIIRIAGEEQVDLIVMATHGLTGWRHLVYGSVAQRVVQLAPCPILAVRPPRV